MAVEKMRQEKRKLERKKKGDVTYGKRRWKLRKRLKL